MALLPAVAPKATVEIPFICPICAGENAVNLIVLSRGGGIDCQACNKWLRAADVMRAIHSPRAPREADAKPIRVHAAAPPRAERVWPPTAASRAAAIPLRKPKQ